jgi:hypothetical protein
MNLMELQRFDFKTGQFVLRDTRTHYACGCPIGSPFHWAEDNRPETRKVNAPPPPSRSKNMEAVDGIYTYSTAKLKAKK